MRRYFVIGSFVGVGALLLGACGSDSNGGGAGATGGSGGGLAATGGIGGAGATGGSGGSSASGGSGGSSASGGSAGSAINLPAGCVEPGVVLDCNPLTSAECDATTDACDLGNDGFHCFAGNTEAPGAPCDNANGPWCIPTYHCSQAPATDAGTGGSAGSGSGGTAGGSSGGAAGGGSPDASVPDASPGDSSTPGSCVGHCGSDQPVPGSNPACYCDAACAQNNDCCADKETACPAPPTVCKKMCCAASDCASGETCVAFDATLGTIGTCQ